MLSQRINKCVFGLDQALDNTERLYYLDELKTSVSLWERSNNGLLYGDPDLGLKGNNSDTIKSLFSNLDPYYQDILHATKDIILKSEKNDWDISDNLAIIKDNEQSFLKIMDEIVFQYDDESKNKIFMIRITELILMFLTFIILTLEARFIFLPAERSIDKIFQELAENQDNINKLFEIAPAALFLIRLPDLNVLQMNALAEHFTGNAIAETDSNSLLKFFRDNLENDHDLLQKNDIQRDF